MKLSVIFLFFLQFCACHCWLVSIQEDIGNGIFVHLCSGAQKSKLEVLTAAHCFNNKMNRLHRLRVAWNGVTEWYLKIDHVLFGKNWLNTTVKFTDDIAWVFLQYGNDKLNDHIPIAPRNFTMFRKYKSVTRYIFFNVSQSFLQLIIRIVLFMVGQVVLPKDS